MDKLGIRISICENKEGNGGEVNIRDCGSGSVWRKGISPLISYVLYLGVATTILVVVLNAGMPLITEMEDTAAIKNNQKFLSDLDNTIKTVASEHQGASRNIKLHFSKGEYVFNNDTNSISYKIKTESEAVSINASVSVGNLLINASPYKDESKRIISVTLHYDNITLTDFKGLSPGFYTLSVRNKGISNDKIVVGIIG